MKKPKPKRQDEIQRDQFRKKELCLFFNRLKKVKDLEIVATSYKEGGVEEKRGKARVLVENNGDLEIVFNEKGAWQTGSQPSMTFSNAFRWTFGKEEGTISLEHLRYGIEKPVTLFQLIPHKKGHLQSVDIHLCGEDQYSAEAAWNQSKIQIVIRVMGPKKNDNLHYTYR